MSVWSDWRGALRQASCKTCKGTGYREDKAPGSWLTTPCPACHPDVVAEHELRRAEQARRWAEEHARKRAEHIAYLEAKRREWEAQP